MGLREQALLAFELPSAPQRVDELPAPVYGTEALRVHAPAGRFLLLCAGSGLTLAFEATLFDLLAEARFPAPRPRRARAGSLIAPLERGSAAACYSWPPGEELASASATYPQLLEIGRLLARLHQLAETHPAAVSDVADAQALLGRLPPGPERDALAPVLTAGLPSLPSGAVHGGLRPARMLFIGDRCSGVLPSGLACSGPLVLDVAETAVGWLMVSPKPAAALRAIVSGYQGLRRLHSEEKVNLFKALRYAAAREGARRAGLGRPAALAALEAVEALGEPEALAAAG